MFSCLARVIAFVAAVQVLGGHWLALQSIAWIGMIATYSRNASFVAAIEKTFDGQHPCSLCKVIKNGREQEKKQERLKVIGKLIAVLPAIVDLPAPRSSEWTYSNFAVELTGRSLSPLTPPPLPA